MNPRADRAIWFTLLILMLTPAPALLQAACPDLVRNALTTTSVVCTDTQRDEACYGHTQVQVNPAASIAPEQIRFEAPGDRVTLSSVQNLHLSPMDLEMGMWGVSLMRLRADLPRSDAARNVTLVAFGDVFLQNTAGQVPELMMTALITTDIRLLPSPDAGVIRSIPLNTSVVATGRLAENTWIQVEVPEGGTGWIEASQLGVEGDINRLNAVDANARHNQPMQAFYFSSGSSTANCSEVPPSGMLIQTPEGVGRVRLTINGVDVEIGSTAFFQTQPGGIMTVSLLEGSATLSALGGTQTLTPGTQANVALDTNLNAVTVPSQPLPYDPSVLISLPLQLLDRPVTLNAVSPPPIPVTMVVEGAVEAVNANIVTIYDIDIEVNVDDPVLARIQVGDNVRIEGNVFDSGNNVVSVSAVTVLVIDVDIIVTNNDTVVWQDSGNCSNPPPPWAPANGWRRRCENVGTVISGGGTTVTTNNGGNGSNNSSDNEDDDDNGMGMGDDDDDKGMGMGD